MTYAARFGILFVMALLGSRISAGINIDNHWYSFFWSAFVALLNAGIRSVFRIFAWRVTWGAISIWAIVLNLFLYWLLFMGAASWLGITANTFGSALLAGAITTISSIICNHFIGFKPKV